MLIIEKFISYENDDSYDTEIMADMNDPEVQCVLGANTISSLEEKSVEAETASRTYDESLFSLLSELDWNFALKEAELTLASAVSIAFSISSYGKSSSVCVFPKSVAVSVYIS
jgi:hypothetical protein